VVLLGYEINWHTNAGDSILKSPFYQKWSQYTFTELTVAPNIAQIKLDIGAAKASNESASVINYLCWLVRVVALIA
jgi:hypothetical protein